MHTLNGLGENPMPEPHAALQALAGTANLVYLVVAFRLALHLLRRVRGPAQLPELLLGLHFLGAMGLGYLLLVTGMVLVLEAVAQPVLISGLIGTGYAVTIAGLMATLVFNVHVFHRRDRGAVAMAVALSLAMWTGWVGYGLGGGFAHGRYEGFWAWFQCGAIVAANLWVAGEPLLYHSRMRRQARLGLAEPLLADRFLLWGLGSLSRTLMATLGGFASLVLASGAETAALLSGAILIFASCCGLFTSATYWLTFFPTPRYEQWVARRYAKVRERSHG